MEDTTVTKSSINEKIKVYHCKSKKEKTISMNKVRIKKENLQELAAEIFQKKKKKRKESMEGISLEVFQKRKMKRNDT